MKFILIEQKLSEDTCTYLFFIFSKDIVHAALYISLQPMLKIMYNNIDNKVVSAGFYDNQIFHGESDTLNVRCHKNTQDVFNKVKFISVFDTNNKPI